MQFEAVLDVRADSVENTLSPAKRPGIQPKVRFGILLTEAA